MVSRQLSTRQLLRRAAPLSFPGHPAVPGVAAPGAASSRSRWRRAPAGITCCLLTLLPGAYSAAPPDGPAAEIAGEPGAGPADMMPFSQVKAGMKGIGRTVFRGGQVEPFDVEIIGKLENIGPKQNLILARLSGSPLEETGVLEGMSGSPVYIDGRIAGAVAYAWPFGRSPIAGITPIEEMFRLERSLPGSPKGYPQARELPRELRDPASVLRGADLLRHYRRSLAALFSPAPLPAHGLEAIGAAIVTSGLPARAMSRLAGAVPFEGRAQGTPATPAELPPIEPGSAIGVALVRGDVQITAVGTVTRVDGDRILAFGHPLLNLGAVRLPLTRARVEALFPSLQSSFKFAGPAGDAGTLIGDHAAGVTGILGPSPRMIPVRIELTGDGPGAQLYAFDVADHPLLSPVLIFLTLGSLFTASQDGEEGSLELLAGSVIRLSGGRVLSLENLFAGQDAAQIGSAVTAFLVQLLMENEFEPVSIEGLNLVARASAAPRVGRIVSAWCDRSQAKPGATVVVSVVLKPYREAEKVVEFRLEIPRELPPGRLTLHVGDASALQRTGAEASGEFFPRDLDHLVALINELRRNPRLYVLATRAEPSVWIGHQALPNLPPSRSAVILGGESQDSAQILRVRPVLEQETRTSFAVEGYRRLVLEIVQ